MPVREVNTGKKRTVTYRNARGQTRNAMVLAAPGSLARSVTITTTSGSAAIIATVGTFTAQDVGAALSGNNANTGTPRTIVSVEDGTHATMSGNAAATDGVGTATTVTRTALKGGAKIRVRGLPASTGVIDNVPFTGAKTDVGVISNRRGPAGS